MKKEVLGNITMINGDCTVGMKELSAESVDVILTDPPYLYLKNQELDIPFDVVVFFSECKRVLKKNGFIVLFGRGTSFYHWNTMLAESGFTFKEEFIWDKSYCSSPLMAVSRVHETISIHTKGKGTINKVKVPYLEMKGHDIDSIITDIKRLKTTFKNTKSLNAVLGFLENNYSDKNLEKVHKYHVCQSDKVRNIDRCVSVIQAVKDGMNPKTIIRTDYQPTARPNSAACEANTPTGDRCVNVVQSICFGMNAKTIIKQARDHYNTIHPTQKPVRLLERLLALVSKPGMTCLDPFAGSASTMEACYNMNLNGIAFEINEKFYNDGVERIRGVVSVPKQPDLFSST